MRAEVVIPAADSPTPPINEKEAETADSSKKKDRDRDSGLADWIDVEDEAMIPDDYRHVMPDVTVITKKDIEGSWADILQRPPVGPPKSSDSE